MEILPDFIIHVMEKQHCEIKKGEIVYHVYKCNCEWLAACLRTLYYELLSLSLLLLLLEGRALLWVAAAGEGLNVGYGFGVL